MNCDEVARKPELAYKLSSWSVKSGTVGLKCEDDWIGCIEEVTSESTSKKKPISMTIVIKEQVGTSYFCHDL
jgi:hypothetical protein